MQSTLCIQASRPGHQTDLTSHRPWYWIYRCTHRPGPQALHKGMRAPRIKSQSPCQQSLGAPVMIFIIEPKKRLATPVPSALHGTLKHLGAAITPPAKILGNMTTDRGASTASLPLWVRAHFDPSPLRRRFPPRNCPCILRSSQWRASFRRSCYRTRYQDAVIGLPLRGQHAESRLALLVRQGRCEQLRHFPWNMVLA